MLHWSKRKVLSRPRTSKEYRGTQLGGPYEEVPTARKGDDMHSMYLLVVNFIRIL